MLSGSIALLGVVATLVIFYVMASPTFGWTGARPWQQFRFSFLLGVVATLVIFYVMASPTFGWTGTGSVHQRLGLYRLGAAMCILRMHLCTQQSE